MTVRPPIDAPAPGPGVAGVVDQVLPPRGAPSTPAAPRAAAAAPSSPRPPAAPAATGAPTEGRAPVDPRSRAAQWQRDHQQPANTNAPDPGRVLAVVPRGDGTEFRVSLHTYEGKPFVRLAPWSNGWPVKGKGATVKVREIGAVVAGLCDAMDAIDGDASTEPQQPEGGRG